MRECQSVSELSIREVSDGRERVERAAPPVTRGHGLALDGAGLTLGRPKIIAKLSPRGLDFGTQRYRRTMARCDADSLLTKPSRTDTQQIFTSPIQSSLPLLAAAF